MKADPAKIKLAEKMFRYFSKGDKKSPRNVILAILAVLYVLSPFDIVPDWFPIIGWLDDAGILGTLLYFLLRKPTDDNSSDKPLQ